MLEVLWRDGVAFIILGPTVLEAATRPRTRPGIKNHMSQDTLW